MKTIVKKFGGTSLGSADRLANVVKIISDGLKHNSVIAVVSAMSGTTKAEGMTSQLLRAAGLAHGGKPYQEPLDLIMGFHLEILGGLKLPTGMNKDVESQIVAELAQLSNLLKALSVIQELSHRSEDLIMAVGERLSALLLCSALRAEGIGADRIDLSNIVTGNEKQINPEFFKKLQNLIRDLCEVDSGNVAVVTGFMGMIPGGLLKAVGRGYSDFTAALISAGFGPGKVKEMQVWKEVDGIFTADPRRVPNARVLRQISPVEASELTYFGSEVLHPFTMERVVSANIPIRVMNSIRPRSEGTVIEASSTKPGSVTAVTIKTGITVITVHSNRMYHAHGFLARVFGVLDNYDIVVDLVSTSEVSISFTIEDKINLEFALSKLKELGKVNVNENRAIVACVGEGMKLLKGTAGKMFSALGEAGINIEVISQGASEINISCVVQETSAVDGLRAVHRAFLEGG